MVLVQAMCNLYSDCWFHIYYIRDSLSIECSKVVKIEEAHVILNCDRHIRHEDIQLQIPTLAGKLS